MLDEADRLISLREGDRTVTLSMKQAIIRGLFVDAVKGDPRARRHVLEAVALREDEAQRAAEQASGPSTMKVIFVDAKVPQADADAEADS